MTFVRVVAGLASLALGLLLAALTIGLLSVDHFAFTWSRVALGYVETAALGVALALASDVGKFTPSRRALLGAALALALTYAARAWPTPWVNLYSIGAGSGPAGELPLLVLPACAVLLGLGFCWEQRPRQRRPR